MAKNRRSAVKAPARPPERKWGPFPGGVSCAVWLNSVETEEGTKYFRSVTIQGRRFRDKVTGLWRDAKSLRSTDLPALMLALEAAQRFMNDTPLPGVAAESEEEMAALEEEVPENGDVADDSIPY